MQGFHLGQVLLVQHGVRLPHDGLLGLLLLLLRGRRGPLQGQVALGRLRVVVVVGGQGQLLLLLVVVVLVVVVLVVATSRGVLLLLPIAHHHVVRQGRRRHRLQLRGAAF